VSHLFTPAEQPGLAEEITMMATGTDEMRDRIAAYPFPRGGVEVVRANRGYTLYSRRTLLPACAQPATATRFR
jgi:hypothetical protein